MGLYRALDNKANKDAVTLLQNTKYKNTKTSKYEIAATTRRYPTILIPNTKTPKYQITKYKNTKSQPRHVSLLVANPAAFCKR